MPTSSDLAHFTGSDCLFHDRFAPGVKYTQGVKFLRDNGMNWFVSDLLVILRMKAKVASQAFVAIKLIKDKKGGATVRYEDGDNGKLFSQKYDLIDSNACEVTLFYTDGVLMLSSEY
jgi:hypothetical protein